jgi:DNA polymerase-1
MVHPKTGRVHTNYAQAVAVTGRLVVDGSQPAEHPGAHRRRPPHPRGVRRAARGSKIVSADYSQIELRIMAHPVGRQGASWRRLARARTCTATPPPEVFDTPRDQVDASSAATPR